MVFSSWSIRNEFVQTIRSYGDVVVNRVLPSFSNLEAEADRVTQEKWDELGSSWGPDDDPALAAEFAQNAGIDHYVLLSELRQGFLNWSAAALYHLFEQQMLLLLRNQMLNSAEENETRLLTFEVLVERLEVLGVDVKGFESWPPVRELRDLANTVKHAEGRSSRRLAKSRPDLFVNPLLRGEPGGLTATSMRIFLPIAGQDIFVQPDDFDRYVGVVVGFLEELAESLD